MPELNDKIAIVTGAAKGLGRAVAEALASEGATVVVTDIDEAGAGATADAIDRAEAAALDVRDDAAVEALIGDVAGRHGKVDVVVANAGIATVTPFTELTFEVWRQVQAVNLDGVFSTIRHAARSMTATGGGSIIAMASITGFAGSPLLAHYAAAKAGVINLVKTAAVELKAANIRVNAICPGFIGTDLVNDNAHFFEEILQVDFTAVINQAQGRLGEVGDVAPLAAFLASERSRFSTGSAFVVDGGMIASLV
jgi:NAD(P)-dependent dehydrogenase (short-subunit alcohol dehydrogenase family)